MSNNDEHDLVKFVLKYIQRLCHEKFDDREDWVDIVSSRKFAENYVDDFEEILQPDLEKFSKEKNIKISEKFNEVKTYMVNEILCDYRYTRLAQNFEICKKCNHIWVTPEYECETEGICYLCN